QQRLDGVHERPRVPGFDVERGVTARLARDVGVIEDRGRAGGQRLERRQAESFVLGQERERARAAVEVGELFLVRVPMPPQTVAELLALDRRRDVLERVAAVVADDVEGGVGMCTRDRGERANQIEHVSAVEDRSYVEQPSSPFAASRGPLRDSRSDDADLAVRNAEVLANL